MRGKSEMKNVMLLFYDKLMILLYKCCFRIVTILWWKCGKRVVFFWHQIWIWSLFSAILWLVKKSMPKLDDQSRWWKCAVYLPLIWSLPPAFSKLVFTPSAIISKPFLVTVLWNNTRALSRANWHGWMSFGLIQKT